MIPGMSIQIEGVEFITIAEARAWAKENGAKFSVSYIAECARDGNIEGATKVGVGIRSPWVFPKKSFVTWFENRRDPGRPKEN